MPAPESTLTLVDRRFGRAIGAESRAQASVGPDIAVPAGLSSTEAAAHRAGSGSFTAQDRRRAEAIVSWLSTGLVTLVTGKPGRNRLTLWQLDPPLDPAPIIDAIWSDKICLGLLGAGLRSQRNTSCPCLYGPSKPVSKTKKLVQGRYFQAPNVTDKIQTLLLLASPVSNSHPASRCVGEKNSPTHHARPREGAIGKGMYEPLRTSVRPPGSSRVYSRRPGPSGVDEWMLFRWENIVTEKGRCEQDGIAGRHQRFVQWILFSQQQSAGNTMVCM